MWGLQKLVPFLLCSAKSRELGTWMLLLSLRKQQQSICWFWYRPWSLWISVNFSWFPILEGNICVQVWYCCFVPTHFAVQLGVPCWETTVSPGVQKCCCGIFQLAFAGGGLFHFLMSAVFYDSLCTLPSLKVILVSISSLPSWRHDTF